MKLQILGMGGFHQQLLLLFFNQSIKPTFQIYIF